jgi:hypothetical protein
VGKEANFVKEMIIKNKDISRYRQTELTDCLIIELKVKVYKRQAALLGAKLLGLLHLF